ncbi:MAG: Holliday junction branch migration protein RuvA [Myxococcales bacterium]|nr:Holliday junction branch migration protein RuvA [Myxococcales bacterium]
MIAQLQGTLSDKGLDSVVLDVGGVGFHVFVSLTTLQALPPAGQAARLHTYLLVREDALNLYGFATLDEKQVFERCLSVSGVGPKLALAALSGLGPQELADAIVRGEVARLQRIPGIGKKTAERLVMELRDKFHRPSAGTRTDGKAGVLPGKSAAGSARFADVVGALTNLGYKPADAERAVDKVTQDLSASSTAGTAALPSLEDVLRLSLRALQRD